MRYVALAGWILLCYGAAALGGLAAPDKWYTQIRKPSWNPPNWVFAPVWTLLFTMMGVAAWLVWEERTSADVKTALILFGVQLVFNVAWSWIFFGMHRIDLAFLEVLPFWGAILATTLAFHQVRPLAGWLFVPYLAWVTFAAFLTFVLWRLNR